LQQFVLSPLPHKRILLFAGSTAAEETLQNPKMPTDAPKSNHFPRSLHSMKILARRVFTPGITQSFQAGSKLLRKTFAFYTGPQFPQSFLKRRFSTKYTWQDLSLGQV